MPSLLIVWCIFFNFPYRPQIQNLSFDLRRFEVWKWNWGRVLGLFLEFGCGCQNVIYGANWLSWNFHTNFYKVISHEICIMIMGNIIDHLFQVSYIFLLYFLIYDLKKLSFLNVSWNKPSWNFHYKFYSERFPTPKPRSKWREISLNICFYFHIFIYYNFGYFL